MFFETPEELWEKIGLKELTQKTFQEEMASRFSPAGTTLIQEMLYAVNKVNYNQSNAINALAGMGSYRIFGMQSYLSFSSVDVSPCKW